jgi:type I restriction enzyme S subunit
MSEYTYHNILGKIPIFWEINKFDDVAEIIHGFQFRTNDFTKLGIKIFKITQIQGDGTIDLSKCDFIDSTRINDFNKNIIGYNDILMALTGATIGKIARFKSDEIALQNYRVGKFISKDELKLSTDYLYYFLSSKLFFNQLLSRQTQSAQQNIGKEDICNMSICFPNLYQQTAIAEILSSLDDKIELNNKINKELETLAQTLFKQWFIDFEFPNENGEPYKSSGGEMVESELGEIPKGWVVNTLDDISKITIGRTPPRQEHKWFSTDSNDVKWISIRDMGNCGTFIHTTSEFLTEDAIEKFNIPSIEPHTVIMSFKLTVGRISITTERMLSNEAIAHLNLTNSEIYPEFLYLFLKQFNFDSLGSTSSIATAVNTKSIKSLPFVYPDIELLSKFNGVITPLFSRIHNLTFENNELTNLRDTLLPKLISGELEINEISNQ